MKLSYIDVRLVGTEGKWDNDLERGFLTSYLLDRFREVLIEVQGWGDADMEIKRMEAPQEGGDA